MKIFISLRTVPTIVTGIQRYFCAVQDYAEKVFLVSTLGIQKRKFGVAMHFSEIIKLQFGNERHTLLCISKLFTNIVD